MRFLKIVVKIAVALIVFPWLGHAQQNSVSIGTNQINNKAVLWLVPNASGQGLLLPAVSTAVRNGMGLQAADRGMIVFDSNDNSIYLWNGTAWNNLAGGSATTFTGANGINIIGSTISTDAIRPTTAATGDLSGTFANPQIANNAITTAKIATDAVDNSKIANVNPAKLTQAAATNGQVLKWNGTAWAPADDLSTTLTAGAGINIAANVISNTGLLTTSTAAGEVTGTFANLQISNGAITDIKLADNSVTTAKIGNNAVTTTKISDGAVTTNKIGDNSISTAKVQDANITTAKIADGAVTDGKVASGIAVNKLAPGTNGQVLTVSGGQASWQPAPVGSVPTLTNGQILIGNGTVNSAATLSGDATLAAGALTIANNAITTAKILDANVTNAKLANNSVDAGKIVDGSIANADLADNTITDIKIATGANIAATKLAGTVVLDTEAPATGDITGNFSTGLQIAANAVTTAEINNLAVTDAKIAGMSASKLAGTVAVANGGTGLATAPSNGQLLIGNGTGYTLAPLAAGSGINVTNAAGSITISSTGLTNPMSDPGDIIYGGSLGAPTRLAAGIGFLRGGSPPAYSNVNLASLDVTGILPVTNGGTGLSTFGASAGLLYNSAPTTLGNISNGSAGQMLLMTGSTPSWQTMLGDATINGSGLLSIAANATAGGNIINAINAGAATINGARVNPIFGAQAISTTGTLTTGSAGQFVVNATGNITRINNIATSFPAAQGAANSVLTNDGAGNLSWAAGSGWGLTGNLGTNPALNFLGTTDAQPLRFATGVGGVERMRITETGNVGIGITNPTARLQVNSSGTALQVATTSSSAGNYALSATHTGTGNDVAGFFSASNPSGGTNAHGIFTQADGAGAGIYAASNGTGSAAVFNNFNSSNSAPVVRILNSGPGPALVTDIGLVGIGTPTPAVRLDVNGPIRSNAELIAVGLGSSTEGGQVILGYPDQNTLGEDNGTFSVDVFNSAGENNLRFFSRSLAGVIQNSIWLKEDGGLRLFRDLRPNDNPGTIGQVLTSAGPGLPPTWSPGTGWGLSGNTLTGTERIGSDNPQPLVFETDNTERMRITPTGNIGIGTPTPTGRLGISGGELQLENLGVGLRHFSGAVAVGSSVTATAGGLGTLSNHPFNLFTNGLNNVTILPSGNVGIGATTPASRLDVNGDVRLAQVAAPGIVTDKLYNVGGSLFWNGTNISSGSFSTNDVIPKGSASGLVASGITDNGTLVDITRPSSNGILTRIFNQQGGGSGLGTLLGTVGAQILASDDAQNQVFALQAAAGGTNPSAQMGGVSASASGAVNWNRGVIATAENASATNTGVDAFATGNTGDNYGIRSNVGGTQTNPKYGLYVAASGNGTKYGVYAQGENANYLSGRLGIGAPSPAVSLDVQGTDAINFPKGTAGERPATPSAGAMRFNSTENVMEYYNGTNWYFVTPKVAILSDVKPTGTAGGGPSTGGVWTTRTLNSISGDASFLSLTANQFTIGPGEYRIEAVAPAYQLDGTKLRIFNTTVAQTLVLGSNEFASTGGPAGGVLANCSGNFSLLSSATLVLSHYATTSNTTDGFGIAVSAPLTPEVYAVVKITKLR